MLRFASSPTHDMNLENLRIALLNSIVSKQRNEDLLVRIEDLDKDKNIDGKDKEILELLGLFGIEYTQVIYQSEGIRFHTAMALQLMHEKKAFSCFCSDNWLGAKKEEAKAKKEEYLYDDACANLPAELVIDNLSPFTIRVTKPKQAIILKDAVQGEVPFEVKDLQSWIILNQDKTPTQNFASSVDDMLNDISIVIRDVSNLEDTPSQKHIRASLSYEKEVEYAHVASIVNADSVSVKSLLAEGFLPEAISNYLISTGNETPCEIFTLEESLQWFDLTKAGQSSVDFDKERLKEINKKHLLALEDKELSRYVGFADEEIGKLGKVYLEEASTTKELKSKIGAIFASKEIPSALKENADTLVKAIKSAPYFEEYVDFKNFILHETKLSEEDFLQVFRFVLTGASEGPSIQTIYSYLKNYIGEIIK